MSAIVLLMFESAALVILAATARSALSWQVRHAGDLVVIGLLAAGIVAVSWLLASTLLYTASRLAGRAAGARLLPRLLRHIVDAAFVSALVVGPIAPAAAASADQAGIPLPPGIQTLVEPTEAIRRDVTPTHVVTPGESLWSIAAAEMARRGHGDAVGGYWRKVVAVNEPHLRSGDPDLIYPGEEIILPTS